MKAETTLLSTAAEWRRGFLAGLVFLLMKQQYPIISGVYDSADEEQLFLFASQHGYDVDWKAIGGGHTEIVFVFPKEDDDGD